MISIIIGVYNQEELIKRCLESIPLRDDIEVIIVDDKSTDFTLWTIEEFMRHSSLNVKVLLHEKNEGCSVTYNDGLRLATGDYVYQMDSDDYLYTEEFNKVLDQLDEDVVYLCARENDGTILTPNENNHNLCAMWFKLVKKDLLTERPNNAYGGDYDVTLKLLRTPHTFKYTNLVAYHYNYPRVGSIQWNINNGK